MYCEPNICQIGEISYTVSALEANHKLANPSRIGRIRTIPAKLQDSYNLQQNRLTNLGAIPRVNINASENKTPLGGVRPKRTITPPFKWRVRNVVKFINFVSPSLEDTSINSQGIKVPIHGLNNSMIYLPIANQESQLLTGNSHR